MNLHIVYKAGRLYVAALIAEILAVKGDSGLPVWAVVFLAIVAPAVPVTVGYLLQDKKIKQVHVLVNSRLSKTLDTLAEALVENVALKEKAGVPVTSEDKEKVKSALAEQKEMHK